MACRPVNTCGSTARNRPLRAYSWNFKKDSASIGQRQCFRGPMEALSFFGPFWTMIFLAQTGVFNASSTNSTLCAQPCYHQTVETHSCVSASCQVFAIGDFIRQSCLPRRKNASLQLFVELTLFRYPILLGHVSNITWPCIQYYLAMYYWMNRGGLGARTMCVPHGTGNDVLQNVATICF